MPIKTVISGMGRIGWQFHAPHITENPGFTLAGVCDPLPERSSEAGEKFSAAAFTDYQAMLDTVRPELVVIASPSMVHADQAVAAMEQGIDVFLDKPMAVSLDEATRIVETQRRTGRKLMMYQPMRVRDETTQLKKILQSGVLGNIFMIKMTTTFFAFRNDWQSFRKYGGGMLNNSGAHALDLLLHLAGSPIRRVDCHMKSILSLGDADDFVKVLMETESGVTIDMEINSSAAIEQTKWAITGDKGALTVIDTDPDHPYFQVRYYDPAQLPTVELNDTLAAKDRKYINNGPKEWITEDHPFELGYGPDYYNFCHDYFALGKAPLVAIDETYAVMRVIDACRRSAGF